MSLLDQRSAIVAALQAKLPQIAANIQAHGGRFSPEEIKRAGTRSPALFVACLGIATVSDGDSGTIDAVAAWGCFVCTTDKPQVPRDAGALALLQTVLATVAGNRWGIEDTGYPEQVRGDNLYSGSIDGAGVALWAVSWRQKLTLSEFDAAGLADFLLFHADYDLARPDGQVDASDNIPLEGP